jgi:hypothetical protein
MSLIIISSITAIMLIVSLLKEKEYRIRTKKGGDKDDEHLITTCFDANNGFCNIILYS